MTTGDQRFSQLQQGCENLKADSVIDEFELLPTVDSTNTYAMQRIPHCVGKRLLIVAVDQTQGRGRTTNRWHSSAGAITITAIVPFAEMDSVFSTASLRVGTGICRQLEAHFQSASITTPQFQLKWPNDLYVNQCKLGGILIEAHSSHPQTLAIGVGMNVNNTLPDSTLTQNPAISLSQLDSHEWPLDLALELVIRGLFSDLNSTAPWHAYYLEHCLLTGKLVTLQLPNRSQQGLCQGVTSEGHLVLSHDQEYQTYQSGHITSY